MCVKPSLPRQQARCRLVGNAVIVGSVAAGNDEAPAWPREYVPFGDEMVPPSLVGCWLPVATPMVEVPLLRGMDSGGSVGELWACNWRDEITSMLQFSLHQLVLVPPGGSSSSRCRPWPSAAVSTVFKAQATERTSVGPTVAEFRVAESECLCRGGGNVCSGGDIVPCLEGRLTLLEVGAGSPSSEGPLAIARRRCACFAVDGLELSWRLGVPQVPMPFPALASCPPCADLLATAVLAMSSCEVSLRQEWSLSTWIAAGLTACLAILLLVCTACVGQTRLSSMLDHVCSNIVDCRAPDADDLAVAEELVPLTLSHDSLALETSRTRPHREECYHERAQDTQ